MQNRWFLVLLAVTALVACKSGKAPGANKTTSAPPATAAAAAPAAAPVEAQPAAAIRAETPAPELAHLSPALRVTALLALSGHTRQEIGWLLSLSDAALRQRISQLRRALDATPTPDAGPSGPLAFGRIRRALLGPTRRPEAFLASHDPDGHLFVVSRSHISAPRQQTRG